MTNTAIAVTGAVFAALYAGHMVADHWVQTSVQATTKELPGWPGRLACMRHVATYHLTLIVALTALAAATGWRPHPGQFVAGLTVSVITHYVADRRNPLRWLAERTGRAAFHAQNSGGVSGAYLLDSSWHIGWLYITALIIAA